MKLKDNMRFIMAKLLGRQTVLFSRKAGWQKAIEHGMDKNDQPVVTFFYNLDEVNPDLFDYIIPLTINEQKHLNQYYPYLDGQKVINPSNSSMDMCDDKEFFAHHLVKIGFGDYVPKTNGNLNYPYILKRKIGEWGVGVTVITDAECELTHAAWLESDDYFRQEYIEGGNEYTTHIIIHNKSIVFYRTLEFKFCDRFFVKGINVKHQAKNEVDHSHLRNLFECILNEVKYQGICCFNYKLIGGKVKIFEINPRYGGSMTDFINEALTSYKEALNTPYDTLYLHDNYQTEHGKAPALASGRT